MDQKAIAGLTITLDPEATALLTVLAGTETEVGEFVSAFIKQTVRRQVLTSTSLTAEVARMEAELAAMQAHIKAIQQELDDLHIEAEYEALIADTHPRLPYMALLTQLDATDAEKSAMLRELMPLARYEHLEDGTYFGIIPIIDGLWANAPTEAEIVDEMADALSDWLDVEPRDKWPHPIAQVVS